MPRSLNPQQRAFCTEFVKTGNASKAAVSVGYSEATAAVQACQMLKKPLIAAECERLRSKLEKKSELSAQKVMDTLLSLIDANLQDLHGPDGELLPVNQWPREVAAAVSSIDGKKVRMSSKLQALELAARVLQMVKQQDTFAPVQIIIAPPPELPPAAAPVAQLRPEWS